MRAAASAAATQARVADAAESVESNLTERIAEESARNKVTTRRMSAAERERYGKLHPDTEEIHAGATDGLTLEEVAAKTGGDARRAWFMAQRHQLLPQYRENADAKGVPMMTAPTDIRSVAPVPPASSVPAPPHDPAPSAPVIEQLPPPSLTAYVDKAVKDALAAVNQPQNPPKTVDVLQGLIELLDTLAAEPDTVDADASKSGLYGALSRLVRQIVAPDFDAVNDVMGALALNVGRKADALQAQINTQGERITALVERHKRHYHHDNCTSPPVGEGEEDTAD